MLSAFDMHTCLPQMGVCLVLSCLVWSGLVWSDLVWSGQNGMGTWVHLAPSSHPDLSFGFVTSNPELQSAR